MILRELSLRRLTVFFFPASRRDPEKKVFFVTYQTPDAVNEALKLSGTAMNDVDITVSRRIEGYENDPQPGDPCKVFVGRLHGGIDGTAGLKCAASPLRLIGIDIFLFACFRGAPDGTL